MHGIQNKCRQARGDGSKIRRPAPGLAHTGMLKLLPLRSKERHQNVFIPPRRRVLEAGR